MIPLEDRMVPRPEECLVLLQKVKVPENVVEHSRVVHRVALYLCQTLNTHGESLDQAKIEAGSLLHDIAKVKTLGTGEGHAQAGARLLWDLGFPEVAEIVRQHVVLDSGTDHGRITEVELVHYADKRVKHTTIVSLAERFQDLKERYGKSLEARIWLEDQERQNFLLEERIFQKIPILPESLTELSK